MPKSDNYKMLFYKDCSRMEQLSRSPVTPKAPKSTANADPGN